MLIQRNEAQNRYIRERDSSMIMISYMNRYTRRDYVYLSGFKSLIMELERIMGREVWDFGGEGREGLNRVRSMYNGLGGGVYAFVNIRKSKIYIGSSKDLARRMENYFNMEIDNKSLLKDVKARDWGGIEIVIISKVRGKEEQLEMEYTLIKRVMESKRIKIYNRFKDIEDNKMYGEFIKKRVGNVNMRIGIYRQLKELGTFSEKTREKIRRNAIRLGSGERLKEYKLKAGLENLNAKRVKVLDILTRKVFIGIIEEVINKTGGTRLGILNSMKNNTIYKKRYIIEKVEMVEEENAVEKGGGNKGQFKTGKDNIKYREVMLENVETGEIRVVPLKEVPEITEGTRDGVMKAIKKGNLYKRRYRISYIEKEIM